MSNRSARCSSTPSCKGSRSRCTRCPIKLLDNPRVGLFSGDDPERQANIAFALIFLGILFVGALTIWLFYGAQF